MWRERESYDDEQDPWWNGPDVPDYGYADPITSAAPRSGPPYTTSNPPPAPREGYEYILNPATGEFEERPRNAPGVEQPPPSNTTTTDDPPPYYTTGGDGPLGSFTKSPRANIGAAPSYTAPGTVKYAPFSGPGAFKAPGMADVLKDPGYEFRLKSGEDAIKRNAAARGNLRTGGTEKGLIDYNQTFASNEYGNVYQRAASEYDRLYNNLLGEYKLGYQQALDVNDQEFRNTSAEYAPRLTEWQVNAQAAQRAAELEYLREMDIYKTIYGAGQD